MNFRKRVIWLIVFASLARIVVAAVTELSNDEVYYWTYAQYLQWNYFDHPPAIAVLIRLCTGNLLLQQELFVRLGAILCGAINTWQLYRLGRQFRDEYTGWLAACLFTASIYGSVLAGLMILPDAPQMVFWLWALSLLIKITKEGGSERNRSRRLLLLGLVAGLCIMSKVHGVFIWAGAGLYILLYRRSLLRNPFLYLAVLVTGFVVMPIYWWNQQNDFVTLNYHGGRVGFFGPVQWDSFFRQLIGEFLYNNPVNVVLLVMALLAIRKMPLLPLPSHQRLLLLLGLPLIGVVWIMALFRDTLPHWTGPAYTSMIPLTAAFLARMQERKQSYGLLPRVMKAALGLPAMMLLLLVLSVHWLPVTLGNKDPEQLGRGDLLLDMSGWRTFGRQFETLYQQDVQQGRIKQRPFIISDYWFPAAHLDYYVARKAGLVNIAVGHYGAIHHYAWLNLRRPALVPGQDAYYMTVSNYFDSLPAIIGQAFRQVEPPVAIDQQRQGVNVRHFYIYRLHGYLGGIPHNGVIH